MKLFRVRGRAELFINCGKLLITPMIAGSKTEVLKKAKIYIKQCKKDKRNYELILEKLIINNPSKEQWIGALTFGFTSKLISNVEFLQKWEG